MLPRTRVSANNSRFDYRRYLDRRQRAGNFYVVFRDDMRLMTLEEASLIGHLLNVAKAKADGHGWLLVTTKFLRDGLGLDADHQNRILSGLILKKIIEVEWRGEPERRHVRIDCRRIQKL